MSEPEKLHIVISDLRTPQWFREMFSIALVVFAPIAVGIAVGSTAMEWAGFVMGLVSVLSHAVTVTKRRTFMSFREARQYLAKLEAEALS